jgi:hypothetical protein
MRWRSAPVTGFPDFVHIVKRWIAAMTVCAAQSALRMYVARYQMRRTVGFFFKILMAGKTVIVGRVDSRRQAERQSKSE